MEGTPEPGPEAEVGSGIGQSEAAPDVTSPDPVAYFKAGASAAGSTSPTGSPS